MVASPLLRLPAMVARVGCPMMMASRAMMACRRSPTGLCWGSGRGGRAAGGLAFPGVDSGARGEGRMELSVARRDRLPRVDQLLAGGRLDERRLAGVRDVTIGLTDEQARQVDELLAPDAPDLPYTAL